jgi:hypothetical protein
MATDLESRFEVYAEQYIWGSDCMGLSRILLDWMYRSLTDTQLHAGQ